MISGNVAFRTNVAVIAELLLWLIEFIHRCRMKVSKSAFETFKAAIFCF